MRYPASEKLEIIGVVGESHPPTKQTIDRLGVSPRRVSRWYDKYVTGGAEVLEESSPKPLRVWNHIPDIVHHQVVGMALDEPELSPQ